MKIKRLSGMDNLELKKGKLNYVKRLRIHVKVKLMGLLVKNLSFVKSMASLKIL